MRGVDMLNLPYCLKTNKIDFNELSANLPKTPKDVIEQVFVDHGRSSDFQRRFGCINFKDVFWDVCDESCKFLHENLTIDPFASRWVENVKSRTKLFKMKSWSCIDGREDVVEFWEQNRTWMKPPVIIMRDGKYYLVEGFTRFGVLLGLFEIGVLEAMSLHCCYLGKSVVCD